jgi:toxin ParE1/3/4
MADINWSAEAKRDLRAIAEYFDKSSPEYSKYLVENLFHSISELSNFPKMGRMVPELEQEQFREKIVEGYRVIYLFQRNSVEILTIVHSRQDLFKHLRRS